MSIYEQRPTKITGEKINPADLERTLGHMDSQLRRQDERRIAQQVETVEGDTDADTIQNLLTTVNALISVLNASELTED